MRHAVPKKEKKEEKTKNVPMIFEGVRFNTAVYNLQLYTPPGPSEVYVQPLGNCWSLEKL